MSLRSISISNWLTISVSGVRNSCDILVKKRSFDWFSSSICFFSFFSYSSKILIVEDNEELRELLVRLFSKVYSVYEAQDGEEGFEKTKEVQPDIVLSDIMMPKMSGIEMCRMIKSNFETSHIPVILLTAQTAEEFTIQGLKMGADDYITKPFNVKHLFMRCNNLVNGRKLL